jgi:aspartate carbamoyltransferase catalytic subunit
LTLVSPEALKMRREVLRSIQNKISVSETQNLEDIIPQTDVLYVTRIQKERFPDQAEFAKVKGTYRIDLKTLSNAKNDLIILIHCLGLTKLRLKLTLPPKHVTLSKCGTGLLFGWLC